MNDEKYIESMAKGAILSNYLDTNIPTRSEIESHIRAVILGIEYGEKKADDRYKGIMEGKTFGEQFEHEMGMKFLSNNLDTIIDIAEGIVDRKYDEFGMFKGDEIDKDEFIEHLEEAGLI